DEHDRRIARQRAPDRAGLQDGRAHMAPRNISTGSTRAAFLAGSHEATAPERNEAAAAIIYCRGLLSIGISASSPAGAPRSSEASMLMRPYPSSQPSTTPIRASTIPSSTKTNCRSPSEKPIERRIAMSLLLSETLLETTE